MIGFSGPRVQINLAKIAYNANQLVHLFGSKNIGVMGVTKVVCGCPAIAQIFVDQGIGILADSKLENIKTMREAKIEAEFVLLRTPALSEVDSVVQYADISMNTELSVIEKLSTAAQKYNVQHKIILMIEMGDLREGIMPIDLEYFVQEASKFPAIDIVGIGASFACFGGVQPSEETMGQLSSLAFEIETKFSLPLLYVSGGNSANYNWFMVTDDVGKINNVRLGEAILLGREPLERNVIQGLFTDAFTFISELIEAKIKPSLPYGVIGQNAFGHRPQFQDRGLMRRGILGVGSQDVLVNGMTPLSDVQILGSSSDHIVLDLLKTDFKVGDEIKFSLDYGALLSVMTSPYISKEYIYEV